MANYQKLIPFIKQWEGGFIYHPNDPGGATMQGITLQTYARYCRDNNLPPATVTSLRKLSDADWIAIFLTYYWRACRADAILSEKVAYVLVDWYWCSGTVAVRELQLLVDTLPDGVVGPQTLRRMEQYNGVALAMSLLEMRKLFLLRLCNRNKELLPFRRGWLNRVEALRQYLHTL